MPLFGPRLDQPSAIGDEGRPRATSLTVVSLLVTVLFGAGMAHVGAFRLAMGFWTVCGLVVAGIALLNRDRFGALFIGQLCFVPAGTALVGTVAIFLRLSPPYGFLFVGFSVALVALGSTWADTASASSVRPALLQEGVSYVSFLVWAVAVLLLYVAVWAVNLLVVTGTFGARPTAALLAFLVCVVLGGLFFRLGLRWLPITQLTPRRKRDTVDHWLGLLKRTATLVTVFAVLGTGLTVVLWLLGAFSVLYAFLPPIGTAFRLLASKYAVVAVIGTGLVVFVAGILALLIRRLTRPVDTTSNRLLASVVSGFVFVVGLAPFSLSLFPIPVPLHPYFIVLIVLFCPVVLYLVGGALVLAEYATILPSRSGGPALAAAGMVLATVGTALAGLPAPFVLASAAVAMLVWDISVFGLGVTAELGHLPETRRLELFHAVVGVAIGVVTVLVLTGLDAVRTSLGSGVVVIGAATLAVLGVLLILGPVSGYAGRESRD